MAGSERAQLRVKDDSSSSNTSSSSGDRNSEEESSVGRTSMTVDVPQTANSMARFDFTDLCSKPLAAEEYLAVAQNFHTVFLENVPHLVTMV